MSPSASSSTSYPTQTRTAPWKALFTSHLSKSTGEFVLSSISASGLPQGRYCIHRGFWTDLPENEHNTLPKNPDVYDSDCPMFTTDARMQKVYDVFATGKGKGDREQARSGTGGGGPVEAVYWVKDVKTQWRVRGRAWVLAADDIEGGEENAQNSGTVTVKAELGRYMRLRLREGEAEADGGEKEKERHDKETRKSEWSWRREIENTFENLSPQMRGSFKNPPPGQPIADGRDEAAGEALGQKAGHLADEDLARRNFRVVVITPEQVEAVDLTDPEKATRQIWTLTKEAGGPGGDERGENLGEWNRVETWP